MVFCAHMCLSTKKTEASTLTTAGMKAVDDACQRQAAMTAEPNHVFPARRLGCGGHMDAGDARAREAIIAGPSKGVDAAKGPSGAKRGAAASTASRAKRVRQPRRRADIATKRLHVHVVGANIRPNSDVAAWGTRKLGRGHGRSRGGLCDAQLPERLVRTRAGWSCPARVRRHPSRRR